jgi:hypothetical protein
MKTPKILIAIAFATVGHYGHAEDLPHTAATPILVELFTSEGCSSCPPADAVLQKMDASQPIPGAQLIVLSEHVDYWDHDGWKDAYSSHLVTERQIAYVHALRLSEPYTPQIIVDGAAELRLNSGQPISQILRPAPASQKVQVRIGPITVEAKKPPLLRTHIETDSISDKQNADVYVAVALDHAESQVLHGENGGRHLQHVAVLQSLTKIGKLEKGKSFARDFQAKLTPALDSANIRIVVFLQEPGPGRVVGAAMQKYSAQ